MQINRLVICYSRYLDIMHEYNLLAAHQQSCPRLATRRVNVHRPLGQQLATILVYTAHRLAGHGQRFGTLLAAIDSVHIK